jgi:hypothetical protein
VKHICTSLALIGITFTCYAQEPVSQDSSEKRLVETKPQPVASPNRTSSREWAGSHKPNKAIKDNDDKASPKTGALVWVDSKGETVGRALPGNGGMLVPFENDFAEISGFTDRDCDPTGNCTLSGSMTWGKGQLAYNSGDCTGTPYVLRTPFGARYAGISIVEGGETFIYISDTTQTTLQGRNSVFDGKNCFRASRFNPTGAPVIAVVPASTFGTQPYTLK